MLSTPLAGVNGVYVARMDYQDIAQRKTTKATEMFWAPSPSLPNQGGVLGFLPYWYYAPNGFDFGGDDNTQPVQDDPTLEDYNLPDVVARFNALIDDQVTFTAGTDTMIMMGTDFSGENAQTWYRNIDKLIHHVSTPSEVPGSGKYNLLYSSPSAYTAAKAANTPLPLRTEDVMPCACQAARAAPRPPRRRRPHPPPIPRHAPPPDANTPQTPTGRTPFGRATFPRAQRSRATCATRRQCFRPPSSCRRWRCRPRTCRPPTPCTCWSAPWA